MRKNIGQIKFEILVLISGIVEMILLIVFQFYHIELFTLTIQSLQIIITMFVSRRFLKLYLTLEQKKLDTKIYEYYFYILVICNILFISVCFISYFVFLDESSHFIDEYVSYAHTCFSLIVSIILYVFSRKILKLIELNLQETQKLNGQNYLLFKEDGGFTSSILNSLTGKKQTQSILLTESGCTERSEHNQRTKSHTNTKPDIFLKKRKSQLYFIAFTTLTTDLIEWVTHTLRLFVFNNCFQWNVQIEVLNTTGYIIFTIELLCLWFSSLANYLIFYFMVRKYIQPVINLSDDNNDNVLINDDIEDVLKEEEKENHQIQRFLGSFV